MKVVNRLFTSSPEYFSNIEWFDGDVNDLFSIEEALEGVHTVYHAAAFISFHNSDRKKMLKVNVEGTANLVNLALNKKVKRFCFVSSVAAMGRVSGQQYVNEESWWKTSKENSNYAISKYGAEREVWRGIEEGLSAFIVSPTIVIGPGNWSNGSTQMFSQIWKGLPFYSNGITGFVDVRDVSKAALLLMEKGIENERYILNSENLTYRIVFDMIAENLGRAKSRFKVSPLLGEIGWRVMKIAGVFMPNKPMITKETARNAQMIWYYSNDKVKKELGMEFISIEQSVKDACKFFLSEKIKNYQ